MSKENILTVLDIVSLYNINCIVETGTYMGDTTEGFATKFPSINIHTIEVTEESYNKSKARLSKYSNVACHLGSSDKVLDNLIPTILDKKILFYLDAHWWEHWPLKYEVQVISKYLKDNCIIIIDDIKNGEPGMTGHYDSSEKKIVELTKDIIKTDLDKCYTDYITYFNLYRPNEAGKMYCIPRTWFDILTDEQKTYINKDIYLHI